MPDDHARALVEAEAYLSYDDAAWVTFAAAGVGAALMAVPASLAAIRGGVPKWLGWLGVLAGVVSLATVFFVGMFAWLAWILERRCVPLPPPPALRLRPRHGEELEERAAQGAGVVCAIRRERDTRGDPERVGQHLAVRQPDRLLDRGEGVLGRRAVILAREVERREG